MFQMRIRDVLRLLVLPAFVVIVFAGIVIAAVCWGGR
jgi:hypothetical protein